MRAPIYKILSQDDWRAFEAVGRYQGSADDKRDGFIHFSSQDQVQATAAKHFAGQDDLVLLSVDADALGTALRWEPSRGGAEFPHLYGPLQLAHVIEAQPLPLGPDGVHRFPVTIRT